MVEGERDAWILVAARWPRRSPEFMADKRAQIEDPEVVSMYRTFGEAIDWDPDDPRVPELADRIVALLERMMAAASGQPEPEIAEGTVELLDSVFLDSVPVARRILELLEERGWSGWTQMKPMNT